MHRFISKGNENAQEIMNKQLPCNFIRFGTNGVFISKNQT